MNNSEGCRQVFLAALIVIPVIYLVYVLCVRNRSENMDDPFLKSLKGKEQYTVGNFKRMSWNECNKSISGGKNNKDWMCRNDGYGGYNVVGVGGEEKMRNSRKLMHQSNINRALTSRNMGSLSAEQFRGQTSRSVLMSRPKRSSLHENMVDNKRGDPFYENENVREFNTDAGSPNVYRGSKFSGHAGFAGVVGEHFGSVKEHLEEVVEDITEEEVDEVAVKNAALIEELKKQRANAMLEYDTLYDLDPTVRDQLSVIDPDTSDSEKLRQLLAEKVKQAKKIQVVRQLKKAGRNVDVTQSMDEIMDVAKLVKGMRVSKVVGPMANIMAPRECNNEHSWNSVKAANQCAPYASYLSGAEHMSNNGVGEPATLAYAHAGVSDYANSYKKLSEDCKANWNASGGNDRPTEGGQWRGERYRYGCDFF